MPLSGPPYLSELLGALRADGIPVGPSELTRLHHAFRTSPKLDREALRRFLSCLLVKTPEQRERFDQRFDTWCPDRPAEWEPEPTLPPARTSSSHAKAPIQRAEPDPFELLEPPETPRPWLPAAGLLVALMLAGTLANLLLRSPSTQPVQVAEPAGQAVRLPELPEAEHGLPANPAPRAWYWRAEIWGVEVPYRLMAEELALIAMLSGLLTGGLWWRYRRRTPPPPRLPPTAGGPAWLPLPPVSGSDTSLIEPKERRGLVWNIGRFAGEDLTRRLDEPATATATARAGGLAEIRYKHARFPREVWLWLDEHSTDPALRTLAEEIAGSLGRAGLRVRRGSFAGTPARVWWRRDDFFEPTRMEGHRQHAMVALLSDGAGLARDLDSPLQANHVSRLLRQLRLWPHLVLVDFGPPGRLARRVRPYGLQVIRPRELAAWLGGREGEERPAAGPELQGDLRLWAAACCLGTDPPDPASAQRLRQRLNLTLDAWAIRDLQRAAGDPNLHWPEPRRRTLVNWLLRAGPLDRHGIPTADSPTALAIDWWRARYQAESRRQGERQNRLLPWDRTAARRSWNLEDALLVLFREPEEAIPHLQALAAADPALRDEIRARLGGLRAADQLPAGGREPPMQDAVYFTWALGDLPPQAQDALAELGFGGREVRDRHRGLRPPPRLALTLGLLAGIAAASAGGALYRWLSPPGIELLSTDPLLDRSALRVQTLRLVDEERGRVALGQGKGAVTKEVPPGARVTVAWTWGPGAADNNPVRLREAGEALVFRAGTLAQPIRPCATDWPARSLAAIQGDPQQEAARRLAIRLLDSGTADQVLITGDWERDLSAFVGEAPLLNANTRLLVILPAAPLSPRKPHSPTGAHALISADHERLAGWLAFPGTRPLEQAPIQVLHRLGPMPWHGGPAQTDEDERTGITWVQVCPGTFTMGSDPGADAMSREDEQPAHAVALEGFDIALTETTNGQYRRFRPDHDPGRPGDLPAVDLNWRVAREFCRWAEGDLPSEAQWEHAARGGSIAPWSFGQDQGRLAEYAWYGENSGNEAHPVGQKSPNPLGLRDMHGNVWEWVRDWYGPYGGELQVDPEGTADGKLRVLRGGSFFSPELLRSAVRFDDPPEVWRRVNGFRCVRVPSPQR